jgi:hypothetical protein
MLTAAAYQPFSATSSQGLQDRKLRDIPGKRPAFESRSMGTAAAVVRLLAPRCPVKIKRGGFDQLPAHRCYKVGDVIRGQWFYPRRSGGLDRHVEHSWGNCRHSGKFFRLLTAERASMVLIGLAAIIDC